MPIRTFRGKIEKEQIRRIKLSSNTGMRGFKIKRFDCMPDGFGNTEMVLQLFTVQPTAASAVIDFTNSTLIAAAMLSQSSSAESNPEDRVIIFDNVTFNQDIYLTAAESSNADVINYHIELEQVQLDLNEATVATLKDMRGRE